MSSNDETRRYFVRDTQSTDDAAPQKMSSRRAPLPVSLPGGGNAQWTPNDVTPSANNKPVRQHVREQDGHVGVRRAIVHEASTPVRSPTDQTSHVHFVPGGQINGPAHTLAQERLANAYQQTSTSRQYASSASYPSQMRPGEPEREERVKNLVEFEGLGRNIGPTNVSNVVGAYVGMTEAGVDVDEKFTQRTYTDLNYEYYVPHGPSRVERGNNSVYNQFFQHRMSYRGEEFKNTPGRAAGAFQHEWIRPGFHVEELWRSGQQGHAPRQTMKGDDVMVFRQRADEGPNREGLRVQYSDNYASGFEQLINPRRMQHTVTEDIDPGLLLPIMTNPYFPPIGIVPPRD